MIAGAVDLRAVLEQAAAREREAGQSTAAADAAIAAASNLIATAQRLAQRAGPDRSGLSTVYSSDVAELVAATAAAGGAP